MTKTLLSCCLLVLFCSASVSHAALGSAARSRADSAERTEQPAPQATAQRWPGVKWYLGVGCVSLLALQRLRWFNPQRRQRHPRV